MENPLLELQEYENLQEALKGKRTGPGNGTLDSCEGTPDALVGKKTGVFPGNWW